LIALLSTVTQGGSNTLRIFLNKKSGLAYDKPTSYLNNKQRGVLIKVSDGFEFNLIATQLYSMPGKAELKQLSENADVGQNLTEFIIRTGQDKTIILGDFNLMPFSPVLQSHFIFNALPVKEVVREQVHRRIAHPCQVK